MTIIKYPLATEKSIRGIESDNTLIFVVESGATKTVVKKEIERILTAKVSRINLFNAPDGTKRAYVKFSKQTPAIDIATKLGLM